MQLQDTVLRLTQLQCKAASKQEMARVLVTSSMQGQERTSLKYDSIIRLGMIFLPPNYGLYGGNYVSDCIAHGFSGKNNNRLLGPTN